ncbi:MAG: hypothetical protein EA353_13440 [Puniceicoccaceae bacterium]|nr:MAG: hypothetical protein EA353_13440 [Puniceicoccaceae bacterium]
MKVPTRVVGAIALIITMLATLLWIRHSGSHDQATGVAPSFSDTAPRDLNDAGTEVPGGRIAPQGDNAVFAGDASSTPADPEANAIWINDDLFDAEQRAAWAEILRANGLSWPQRNPDLADEVADVNIRTREDQAMRMIDRDPVHAVAFISAQLEFEEDKVVTRSLRHAWEASQTEESGAIGDPERFVEMFRHAPDRHFDGLVDFYVDEQVPDYYLGQIIGAALERRPELGLSALARLADRGLLPEHGVGAEARRALTDFLDDAPLESDSWHFAVVDRFDRTASSKVPADEHESAYPSPVEPTLSQ